MPAPAAPTAPCATDVFNEREPGPDAASFIMLRLPNRRINIVIVSIICDFTDPASKDEAVIEASPQATRQ